MRTVETDYLVIGCGAAGMAFTDSLISASDAQVVMVDRRHAPGGHWLEAYPFVRLHQPSAYYGVNSLALGSETIDRLGPNKGLYEGNSLHHEAAAHASSIADLVARLEAAQQLLRVDDRVTPTMFKAPTVSADELDALRRIEGVVRLGKVRRIERDRIVLDEGTIPTSARHLHVHCAAPGLNLAPAVPIFAPDHITLQSIRTGLIPFNSAITGFIEVARDDVAEKNRLCPPNRQPDVPLDWLRGTLIGMNADRFWSKEPDILDWLDHARLNPSRGVRQRTQEPRVQEASARFAATVRAGLGNLERLWSQAAREGAKAG
jgi:hypothetical protein